MQFNDKQKQVVNIEGNSVVIGAPGTGKTMLIVVKIKRLISQGVAPESIAITCFSPKGAMLFKALLLKHVGNDAKRIKYGTFKDFAALELNASGSLEGDFADNSQIRRLLHQAKSETGFKGSIHEAEHVIRSFKSQAKKPKDTDDNYAVFSKYQDLIHNRNWYDRYDCLRQHLISLRNDISQPARVKYLFVDNAQDMNQIQLLWTLEHSIVGIKTMLCLDDDQCIFNRSGAMGGKVVDFTDDSEARFEKVILDKSYRLTKNLKDKAYQIVSLADQRLSKGDLEVRAEETSVEIKSFNSKAQELESVVSNIKRYFKDNPNANAAVITRSDEDSRLIAKHFIQENFPFTDYSRNIWEMPGSIVVIDLLEVLLGTATNAVLKNVLSGFGLNTVTVDAVFSESLDAKNWLQNGAKINKQLVKDDLEIKKITNIQTMLISYYRLRSKLTIKDIFKALCFELMKSMSVEDKKDALYAIEKVLNFKGGIKDNINLIRQEKQMNPNSQLILGPVREFRSLEFDIVFMPFCQADVYPYDYKVLGKKNSSDRRIFFTAMTRSKGTVYISYSGVPSTYVKALQR